MTTALTTDLYELTMAVSYLRHEMAGRATFSLFVRRLPRSRGFLVCAGLDDCLEFLEGFALRPDELDYVGRTLRLPAVDLERLAALRFTGDVWAVPEGRIVTATEPLLEVTAPIAEAQLVESVLLNTVTFQTTIASKAARCRLAAGNAQLVDFALRRTDTVEAALQVARVSALVGFDATSNVAAARRFGLVPAGTMAHSYIEAFATEEDAFRQFARDFPDRCTLLVDTYDTEEGVRTAARVIRALDLPRTTGVRLDSGDLAELARRSRSLLDAAGLPSAPVFASGGLDEYGIAALVAAGAPIDGFGVGTKMGVSADAPYLDTAYKLVEYDGRPVAKRSAGKATLPGAKQVFREPGLADTVGLRAEACPVGAEPLLRAVMAAGRRVEPPDHLDAARARFRADLSLLPDAARELEHPVALEVRLSGPLRALTDRLGLAAATGGITGR